MEFAAPLWLWALLMLPIAAAAEVSALRRDRARIGRVVARPLWSRMVERPAEIWRWFRLALLLLGVAGLVLGLARPRWGIVREKVEREGVDVVLVIDTSASMSAEDVQPNRFFLARSALSSLVDALADDRLALVALEGEAYPLVPLTLDADAVGLFLETIEPGAGTLPGTSLGAGLERALDMFVDPSRNNKVVVLISDGEDLEGGIEGAIRRAKEMGVVVHTAGVGSESGSPVPATDSEGKPSGFKRDEGGSVVVSRLNEESLKLIAKGTGGQYVRLTPSDTGLRQVAAAVGAMEQKTLAREYSYHRKERYQWPLGIGTIALALGLLLPLPIRRAARRSTRQLVSTAWLSKALLLGIMAAIPSGARAQDSSSVTGSVIDEALLRPQRHTYKARRLLAEGTTTSESDAVKPFDRALTELEAAAQYRPNDPSVRYNLATGLFKTHDFAEAAASFRALGADPKTPLAGAARYNLGNSLLATKDYPGAIKAYRSALELMPEDRDARYNLELALRAIEEQEQKDEKNEQQQDQNKEQQQTKEEQESQRSNEQKQASPTPTPTPSSSTSEETREKERFQRETGMSKERAMQLLQALQQNEKEEQKKLLAAKRGQAVRRRDW